jgi:hypothetical protein
VFAIFGPDYYRTPLSFYRFAKPRVGLRPDQTTLTIENVPVPAPEEVYRELETELAPLWFGLALARRALLTSPAWQRLTSEGELFYYREDQVHEAIVRRTAEIAGEAGARILFVYVPEAYEFAGPRREPSPERSHLTGVFARAGVDFIDLVPALSARHSRTTIHGEYYFWKDDAPGHFTPAGNRAVAEILADAITAGRGVREDAAGCERPHRVSVR